MLKFFAADDDDGQEIEMQQQQNSRFCLQLRQNDAAPAEVRVELCSKDLWRKFHSLGTEMIITKAGR
jgi:T-box